MVFFSIFDRSHAVAEARCDISFSSLRLTDWQTDYSYVLKSQKLCWNELHETAHAESDHSAFSSAYVPLIRMRLTTDWLTN